MCNNEEEELVAIIRSKDERIGKLEQVFPGRVYKNHYMYVVNLLPLPRAPNYNNYDIHVKHYNSMYYRLCIRHELTKLFQENYLQKIKSHSSSINYANKYIINTNEAECFIPNCYIWTKNRRELKSL